MLDALRPLIESGIVNEATRDSINAAWESKLQEVKSEVRTEIREEFAGRYEHDKATMVKTLDRMVSETLNKEIKAIKEERNIVAKLKIQTVKEMKSAAAKFNTFATRALAEELAEFAQEQKLNEAHKNKLEKFIMSTLAEEINEFAIDKKNLVETKVKLVTEAKKHLNDLKKKFVARSSKAVSEIVAQTLNHEIKQLHEDIKIARQNNFGRKIYEAFATEFTGTYLNENAEVKKLRNEIEAVNTKLTEAKKEVSTKTKLIESKEKDLTTIKNRAERSKILSELFSPLAKSKKEVMSQLLENVQTKQLRSAYDKYLPAVLNNTSTPVIKEGKSVLNESTGDKKTVTVDADSLVDIKRLAGLK
jgi:hypothetical protein